MKTIASLEGPEFLRACNRTRHAVEAFLSQTRVLDLRKVLPENLPEIPDDVTEQQREELEAQRDKMLAEQAKKNISAMLDRLLDEEAEATYNLLMTLMIPEKGEEPEGIDLLMAAFDLFTSKKVMDFFIRLVKSAPSIMGG